MNFRSLVQTFFETLNLARLFIRVSIDNNRGKLNISDNIAITNFFRNRYQKDTLDYRTLSIYSMQLMNVAESFSMSGNYSEADKYFRESLNIWEDWREIFGDSTEYKFCLFGFAVMQIQLHGDINYLTDPLFQDLLEKIPCNEAANYPWAKYRAKYANFLLEIIRQYHKKEIQDKFEIIQEHIFAIIEHPRNRSNPLFSIIIVDCLDIFPSELSTLQKLGIIEEILTLYEKKGMRNHPNFAYLVMKLCRVLITLGNYQKAEQYLEYVVIYRKGEGFLGAVYTSLQVLLALVYIHRSRHVDALPLISEILARKLEITGQIFSLSSESRRSDFGQEVRKDLHLFLSLAMRMHSEDSLVLGEILNSILYFKGLELETGALQRSITLQGRYPELIPIIDEIATLRETILEAMLNNREVEQAWVTQKEFLEAELARQIPEVNLEKQIKEVNSRLLSEKLEGKVLIEFFRVDVSNFQLVDFGYDYQNIGIDSCCYIACVLLPASIAESIRVIDLGEAGIIGLFWI